MNRLNNTDSLTLAMLLAKKLTADLIAEDTSSVTMISKLLLEFNIETMHVAVKSIPIEYIIKHNIDQNESFYKIIRTIVDSLNNHEQAKGNNNSQSV